VNGLFAWRSETRDRAADLDGLRPELESASGRCWPRGAPRAPVCRPAVPTADEGDHACADQVREQFDTLVVPASAARAHAEALTGAPDPRMPGPQVIVVDSIDPTAIQALSRRSTSGGFLQRRQRSGDG
jgi:hypothetical protein